MKQDIVRDVTTEPPRLHGSRSGLIAAAWLGPVGLIHTAKNAKISTKISYNQILNTTESALFRATTWTSQTATANLPGELTMHEHQATPEQEAEMAACAQEWTRHGLSTEPAERKRAEDAIRWIWKHNKFPKPRIFWTDSPMANCLTYAYIKAHHEDIHNGTVSSKTRYPEPRKITDPITPQMRQHLPEAAGRNIYGQHDASWLAFYRYLKDYCGLAEETQELAGLWELAQSAGWAVPYYNAVYIAERHCAYKSVNNGTGDNIHCEDGAAILYPDGWGVYGVNGVIVPKDVVLAPEKQTLEEIDGEQNEEIKRIRIDRYGTLRYLEESGAKSLDERLNDIEGTHESLMKLNNMTVLVCSSPSADDEARVFSLEVAPDIKTCEDSQRWIWGGKKFRVIART